jgi:hypothetical protein
MRRLLPILCLTLAVLLVSAGMNFALPPCPSENISMTSAWSDCSGTWVDKSGNELFSHKHSGELIWCRLPDNFGAAAVKVVL